MDVIVSINALKDSDVRLFPASRNRSKRVHKKLVKRFGGEFKKVPCIYRVGGKLIAHPDMYAQLQAKIGAGLQQTYERNFYDQFTTQSL